MLGQLVHLLLVVAVVVKGDGECNLNEYNDCMQDVLYELYQPRPGFPDETFFNEYCRPGIETAECFRDEGRKCPEVEEIAKRLRTLEEIVDLVHSVCDEGSELKKGYLANLDCYNRSVPQMKECVNQVENVVHTFFEKERNVTGKRVSHVDSYCLFQFVLVKCAVKVSTAQCGSESAAPLVSILNLLDAIPRARSCYEDKHRVFEAKYLAYIEEIGYELKKRRK